MSEMSEENEEQNIAEIMCSLGNLRSPHPEVFENLPDAKETVKRKYKKYERKNPKRRHEIVPFSLKAPYGSQAVPNGDVIHTYPKLLIEYLGGGDVDRFRNWMTSVCHPEIEMVMECSGESNPFGPNNRQFTGVNLIIGFFLMSMTAAPDTVFQIHDQVKTTKNEATGLFFQTLTCIMEMNRAMTVVDTVSTIDARIEEQRQADKEKEMKDLKRSKFDPISITASQHISDTSSVSSNDTNDDFESTERGFSPKQTERDLKSEDVASGRVTTDRSIDQLTQKLAAFSVKALQPTLIKKTYNVSQLIFDINADRKITRICNLFCIMDEKPTKKINGIYC